MKLSLLQCTTWALFATGVVVGQDAKTLGKINSGGRRLSDSLADGMLPPVAISSFFVETCQPGKPISFAVSGGKNKGVIGLMDNTAASVALTVSAPEAKVEVSSERQPNILSLLSEVKTEEGNVGIRFNITEVPDAGSQGTLTCGQKVEVLLMLQDDSKFGLEYDVSTKAGSGGMAAETLVTLKNSQAKESVKGTVVPKGRDNGGRRLTARANIHDETKNGLIFDSDGDGSEVVLVQVELLHESGRSLVRTILAETRPAPAAVSTLDLTSADVSEEGHLDLVFSGITSHVLLKARITVEIDGKPLDEEIEVSTMTDTGKIEVHGGWIRKIMFNAPVGFGSSEGWEVHVAEAIALDPENGYEKVGEMAQEKDTGIASGKGKLSTGPTKEERDVSLEMQEGRRPEKLRRLRGERKLQTSNKKILVHGYCAESNPFPTSQFSNEIPFSDAPGSPTSRRRLGGTGGGNNWSHDLFARKILHFASVNNIGGCGIIAHSQGGLASLHLYTYYWSCLDYPANSGRMIQSVGSPYQGTNLAGDAAALGDIFGVGCGTNNDLTESGAAAWLSYIPSWARSQVNYYTTSFKDRWWAYDYCQIVSDVLLSDPDDGVIEKGRGQLSGASNRGHKTNWCHSSGMRDDPQYLDSNRNSEMNSLAQY